MMQTGRLFTGGVNTPHAGCVATYLLGRRTDLPAHVLLPEPMGHTGGNMPHGQDAGFLGKAYDPFALMADPSKPNFKVPDLLPPPQIGEARLERRRKLRDVVEETVKQFEASEDAKLLDSNFEAAFRLMTSPQARAAFDLSKEPHEGSRALRHESLRAMLPAGPAADRGGRAIRHGQHVSHRVQRNHLGHPRLEPFISVEQMRKDVAPMYDQAYSALLEDLVQRGMLDNTLVCNLAEFGRTPRINPAGGRDHWPQCWTVYFAGGGVQGGRVVGRSDAIGGVPAERPVDPAGSRGHDLPQPRVGPRNELPGPQGRPFPLVDYGKQRSRSCFDACAAGDIDDAGGIVGDVCCASRDPRETASGAITGHARACRNARSRRPIGGAAGEALAHRPRGAAANAGVEIRRGEDFVGQISEGIVWSSSDPKVASVKDGVAVPVANGSATLTAKVGDRSAAVDVIVADFDHPASVSFRNHVRIGAVEGRLQFRRLPRRGGRQERLQAFAPRLRRRRRLFHDHAPGPRATHRAERSGSQPAADQADRGAAAQGRRAVRSRFARVPRDLLEWIAAGAPAPKPDDPRLEHLEILPARVVLKPGDSSNCWSAPASPTATSTTSPAGRSSLRPTNRWPRSMPRGM